MSDESPLASVDAIEAVEMTEIEKTELRQAVIVAKEAVENGYWDLASLLHRVWDDSLFTEWGYDDFASYIDGELNYTMRTAQYLVRIAGYFGKMDEEIQVWVKALGWSKAKELVKRVTPENFAHWKKIIAGKSVAQIQALLKEDTGSDTVAKEATDEEKPKRMGFSLFEDQTATVNQALEKCKDEANSDKDGNALTLICQDYLSSGDSSLDARLLAIEKTFGVKIIAVRIEEGGVSYPYGEANLDELLASDDEPDGEATIDEETVAPDDEAPVEGDDLGDLNQKELVALCKERGIVCKTKDSKPTLIGLLSA